MVGVLIILEIMEYPIIVNTSQNHVFTELFSKQPGVTIAYISVLSVATLTGTLGNMLVLASVGILMRRQHAVVNGYSFICNLACSDLMVTAIINPFAILGKFCPY